MSSNTGTWPQGLPKPRAVPEPGFYRHYKHDPNGAPGNHTYEVLYVGFHTEDDTRPGEEHFVIYRPLYESSVYKASQVLNTPCVDARPLLAWMGSVPRGDAFVPRYSRITDDAEIRALEVIRDKMYG